METAEEPFKKDPKDLTPEDLNTEVRNGILNLVIVLCQDMATRMSMDDAKAEVAHYLNKIRTQLLEE